MIPDVGSKEYVAKKQSKSKLQALQNEEDLRSVLSTVQGRSVLWTVLSECGIYHHVFSPEQEGKRRLGLWLLGEIQKVAPNAYVQMQVEYQTREARMGKDE